VQEFVNKIGARPKGSQGVPRSPKGVPRGPKAPRVPNESQGVPRGLKRSQGVPRGPTGSQGVLRGPKGFQGVPRGPKRSQGVPLKNLVSNLVLKWVSKSSYRVVFKFMHHTGKLPRTIAKRTVGYALAQSTLVAPRARAIGAPGLHGREPSAEPVVSACAPQLTLS
jgi:hypothetical protein